MRNYGQLVGKFPTGAKFYLSASTDEWGLVLAIDKLVEGWAPITAFVARKVEQPADAEIETARVLSIGPVETKTANAATRPRLRSQTLNSRPESF